MLNPTPLPKADIVYLCAGVNGTLNCALNPHTSYKTNVDGTIWVAEECERAGSFLVWISSTTVQWQNEHYGRQKRTAEQYLRRLPNVGVVRAGRCDEGNVDDLCRLLISVGRGTERLYRGRFILWNEDEQPYAH